MYDTQTVTMQKFGADMSGVTTFEDFHFILYNILHFYFQLNSLFLIDQICIIFYHLLFSSYFSSESCRMHHYSILISFTSKDFHLATCLPSFPFLVFFSQSRVAYSYTGNRHEEWECKAAKNKCWEIQNFFWHPISF